jgi:hypothetical protein
VGQVLPLDRVVVGYDNFAPLFVVLDEYHFTTEIEFARRDTRVQFRAVFRVRSDYQAVSHEALAALVRWRCR